jgi:hypothetical protein
LKSFLYLSVFALIVTLSIVTIQDAHASSVTISDLASCESISGAVWSTSPDTCTITIDQTINSGETWTVNTDVIVFTNPLVTITVDNGGTIDNSGIIRTTPVGDRYFIGGNITNSGTINNNSGGSIGNGGRITNSGTINNEFGGSIQNANSLFCCSSGYIINSGSINNNGDIYNDSSIDNSGSIQNNSGGTIENIGNILNSGIITNNGELKNFGYINNSGSINNSNSITNNSLIDNQCGAVITGITPTGTGTIINFSCPVDKLILNAKNYGVKTKSLEKASKVLSDGDLNNDHKACKNLDEFIKQVNKSKITQIQKDELIADTNAIKVSIGC